MKKQCDICKHYHDLCDIPIGDFGVDEITICSAGEETNDSSIDGECEFFEKEDDDKTDSLGTYKKTNFKIVSKSD